MAQADKLSMKAFWEAVEHRLAECDRDDLCAILRAMAQETSPGERRAFLLKLQRVEDQRAVVQRALRQEELLAEIDRILAMPDGEACALASDNTEKCEDIRVQFITVLIFYYKKLLELRRGNPEAWDEVDELYVHD